jgi:tRNA-splicing ligase RtcB (3'-phosphate/5'-hydroxy nucleic acid ligase)
MRPGNSRPKLRARDECAGRARSRRGWRFQENARMEILEGSRVPIYSWAAEVEAEALRQARNLADLEVAIDHVALMPDAHSGFGMPIGGVLFTAGAVVPYAIGVDIGCGVQVARTNLVWEDSLTPQKLRAVLRQIQRDVPTGFAVHRRAPMDKARMLELIGLDPPASIAPAWLDRALLSLGTLGGGNHFLEVQRDDENRIHFMLHSGSRNLGKQICDVFARRALAVDRRAGRELPDPELAYLRFDEDEDAERYWDAMLFALRWAELNRRQMMDRAEAAFRKHASVHRFDRLVDVHHNYAVPEDHVGVRGIVHRKGAVRAWLGDTVLIPGSMGTASYIGEGLGNRDSFETCQHGAGRALGRNAAKRAKSSAEVFTEMAAWGIEFLSNEPRTAAEEAAFAYKDIESVMALSADLVRPMTRLRPLGVVKG